MSEFAGEGWSRSTSYTRALVTSLGEIELTVVKVKKGRNVTSPLLDALAIRRRRYTNELRMLLADMAARLSYGDTRRQFRKITGIDVPKRTIHSFVQEIGRELGNASASRRIEGPIVVMADGTKTYSVYPTPNYVKVAISYDENSGEKRIVSMGVNKGWRGAQGRTPEDSVIITDAEEEIPLHMDHSDLQLDLVHAVKDALYRMWMDGSSRKEREEVSEEMKRILYTLVNSVGKHLEDQDMNALSRRIESTTNELSKLADEMEDRNHIKTSNFIRSHARFMVTFAKVALERHTGQKRKDQATPYIVHPFRIFLFLMQKGGIGDETVLASALLHDLIEDTKTDYDELKERFGEGVAEIVAAISKDKRLPEKLREEKYAEQLENADWKAKLVKLGDIYDNLSDMHNWNPPHQKVVSTLEEKVTQVKCLRKGLPKRYKPVLGLVQRKLDEMQSNLRSLEQATGRLPPTQ